MNFDFSIQSKPIYPLGVGVDAIYHIHADADYQVVQKELRPQKYYFCLTTDGEGEIISDGTELEIKEGAFVLVQPKQSLVYHTTGEHWKFWWVECYSSDLEFELAKVFPLVSQGRIGILMEQALLMAKKGEWYATSGIWSAIVSLLASSIGREHASGGIPAAAEDYIRENLDTVTVARLCEHLDISDRTLRNVFHRAFHMSPKRYILKARMELARQFLEDTSFSIGGIAAKLGFANPFHFSGSFKAYYGMSPSEYRKTATLSAKAK